MTNEERFWNRRRLAETLTAVAALWGVVALLTLLGGWRSAAGARAAADWTPVTGQVTAAEVGRVTQGGRVPFSVRAVRVSYTYDFDGQAYTGDRLRADGDRVRPESAAGRAWLALAPGDGVTVYVNPADPSQAVLDRTATGRWLTNGLILLAMAVVVGVVARRM